MGLAARFFNGTSESSLIQRITPTEQQRVFLQRQWNVMADALKATLRDRGFPVSTWIQGSYKYGTLLKPVAKGEEYDVDLGIYFEWGKDQRATPGPQQLREWVHDELKKFATDTPEVEHVEEPPKEWCSRTKYRASFHIDTPVYHHNTDTLRARIAGLGNTWADRDPEPLYNWFLDVVSEDRRDQLKRIVRYLKAWAVVGFEGVRRGAPSSVMLSVLAAESLRDLLSDGMVVEADDDVLREVCVQIQARIQYSRKVRNPVDASEDLNRIPDEMWRDCESRITHLSEVAVKASESADEAAAALMWSSAFSYLMPLAEAEEQEVATAEGGTALMQVPEILIQVFEQTPKRFVASHRNEVPAIAKGYSLSFSITNPQIIPNGATIEWTVRNADAEADACGDLGHRRVGINLLSCEEVTAYAGNHYMDCVVIVGGSVYATRRVPVTIVSLDAPRRVRPKPAYNRLRSILRRRR
jgi:Adenylyl/Guanylyl and SMODS C-terminal sensor domain